jgi:hypothetical protein
LFLPKNELAFFPIQKIINEDVAINKMACLQPIDIHHCSRWWGYKKPIPSLVSQMIAPFFCSICCRASNLA